MSDDFIWSFETLGLDGWLIRTNKASPSPTIGIEASRELLAGIYGCPVDLVDDVVAVRTRDL